MSKEGFVDKMKNVGRGLDVVTIGATAMVPGLGQYHIAAVSAALAGEVFWRMVEAGKASQGGKGQL